MFRSQFGLLLALASGSLLACAGASAGNGGGSGNGSQPAADTAGSADAGAGADGAANSADTQAVLDATAADTQADTSAAADSADAVADSASADAGKTDAAGADTAVADTTAGDAAKTDTAGGDSGAADAASTDATASDAAVKDVTAADTAATDSAGADATDTATPPAPKVQPVDKTFKVPYSQEFACGTAIPEGWAFDPALDGGLGWAVDATPTPPAKTGNCALNFNNGKDFACPTGAKDESAYAIGPKFDATSLGAGTQLRVKMALAGGWETGTYDNLDLELSTDDKAWTVVKSYDPPSTDWSLVSEDLSAMAGKTFRLRLHFWAKDCIANSDEGPFVDDFKVYDATCKGTADCEDGNACTDDSCDTATGKCSNKTNTAACDDGQVCTDKDTCANGKCSGAVNTAACDDGNPCTKADVCSFGTCKGAPLCDDGNPCTDDSCDSKTAACKSMNKTDGATCTDDNACTTGDACAAGKCTSKGPATDGNYCTDSDPCTTGEACLKGACTGGKAACDDGNPCTEDVCTKKDSFSKTCSTKPAAEGAACNDGMTCSADDKCSGGQCVGTETCNDNKFADTFECGKANGWTLDPAVKEVGWALDGTPAVPAPKTGACTLNFNNGKDYDNGGTVKGGATSAPIDLSGQSAATLAFWSYADVGDTTSSYDQRWVEILVDGKVAQSKQLTAEGDLGKWVIVKVDLTPQAGKTIQVRLRFDSVDSINNAKPGWFVDDMTLNAKK